MPPAKTAAPWRGALGDGGFVEPARPFAASHSRMRRVDIVIAALSRPLRLAVLGEPGSGKTSFINFLLDSAVLPLTHLGGARAPVLLRYAPEFSAASVTHGLSQTRLTSRALRRGAAPPDAPVTSPRIIYQAARSQSHLPPPRDLAAGQRASYVDVGAPNPILRELEFLEMACTADDWLSVGRAVRLLRSADAAIWCTVAPQAWKESERRSWTRRNIRFGGRSMLLVTFRDALAAPEEEPKLNLRLEHETRDLFADRVNMSLKPVPAPGPGAARAGGGQAEESERLQVRDAVNRLIARASELRFARAQRLMERLSAEVPADVRRAHPALAGLAALRS